MFRPRKIVTSSPMASFTRRAESPERRQRVPVGSDASSRANGAPRPSWSGRNSASTAMTSAHGATRLSSSRKRGSRLLPLAGALGDTEDPLPRYGLRTFAKLHADHSVSVTLGLPEIPLRDRPASREAIGTVTRRQPSAILRRTEPPVKRWRRGVHPAAIGAPPLAAGGSSPPRAQRLTRTPT